MSRQMDPSEQGRLQGALAGLRGIAGLAGPALFTSVFAAAISHRDHAALSGAPYLLAAGMLVIALGLAWHATRR
jgi:DHA1 family tetracycline resistance protein-like MFS transporter